MKYRAVITIDFDAVDYLDLNSRKQEVHAVLSELHHGFGEVAFKVTERRPRLSPRAPIPHGVWHGEPPQMMD